MAKRKLTQANYDAIRDHLFDRIHTTGEQVKNDFPNILRTAIEAEAWKHFADGEGKPFANLVEWLHYTFPHGTSMGQGQHAITYLEAIKLTEGASDVHRVLLENAPNKGHGGDGKSAKARENQATSAQLNRKHQPSSAVVLAARLAQEKPKFYDAYLRGDYKTITAAATAAGLLKDHSIDLRRAKSAFRKMTTAQRAEFLKWMKTDDAAPTYNSTKK